ncbi:MAG: DNA-3-methyladenine glycosylase I [Chloroflexi bacterium]|nr:DNA-3-methyladenine glycosylase I [Chloroflexota bacterium]
MPERCQWANGNPLMLAYHDEEWGKPVHDDRRLFEFLVLEGAQAGLSWNTILNKRENYRAAFNQFDPQAVAAYSDDDITRLLVDAGIVRNRLKITSAINNARLLLKVQHEYGSFDSFIWQFVGNTPRRNSCVSLAQIPAKTVESDTMSRELVKRGFTFVGSTICYAFMQATGMVNDHLTSCFRYSQL